ncbi:electron transport complex subunit RsxC [Kaarinaea lacus]
MIERLFDFHGGVHLRQHKKVTTKAAVQPAKLPKRLVLPLLQHIGHAAEPIVNVGEKVYKGQIIAKAVTQISAPVHAPTSGTVVEIKDHAIPHPSGLNAPCIVIETDGFDQARRQQSRHLDHKELSPEQLREVIRNAGIVGLGGAGFPSSIKLDPDANKVETLILNGAECEPYITCDEMLMREQAVEIVEGLLIMRHALQASHCLIAIENQKTKALKIMQQAVENAGYDFIEVVGVPTVYPMGGEKQLIRVLTGKEVPSQGIPLDIGIVCHNVGTAYAICRAVEHGEPLISRYVTVAGSVAKPRNVEVLIGTPVSNLIEECGGNRQTLSKVIVGGPMMGFAVHDDEVPVIKTTNCVLVNSVIADVPLPSRNEHALPCIRCGSCADACPMELLPQQLYWYAKAKDFDKVQDYNIFDCIECGCCDYVCPSHIPLVQYYRYAKTEIWNQEREKKFSDRSRERHEFHQFRLEREKQEREARHRAKRAEVSKDTDQDQKKAAIQAAMERVRKKREDNSVAPKNTDNLTAEQQRLIAEADERRAKKTAQSKKDAANKN